MTEIQKRRHEFKKIFDLCCKNGVYDAEEAKKHIKHIAESASDLEVSSIGKKEGANFVTTTGKAYIIGASGNERLGYYLFLLDEYKAYERDYAKPDRTNGDNLQEEQTINIMCVAEVEKKDVNFLFEPYIVKNNVNILAGDGGVGKTFVWVDFASATSKGLLPNVYGVPESFNNDDISLRENRPNINDTGNRRVLYLSSEDSTATTLKDRFEAAGADTNQLCFVPSDDKFFHKILLDSPELEQCIATSRPVLVILDPLQSFVHGKMSERNNMRRQMDCLTALAQRYDTTFLLVVHTNKLQTTDARTKLSDSSDIWDKCRSVMFVGRTKDGLRYFSQEKGNYTTDKNRLDTQLFTIKDNHIVHKGTTEKKFFDFATESAFSGRDSTQRDNAKEFILTSLKDGEMLVKDLDTSAESFGISRSTFKRAKTELNESNKIKYRKEGQGKDKGVVWYISLNTVSNESSE